VETIFRVHCTISHTGLNIACIFAGGPQKLLVDPSWLEEFRRCGYNAQGRSCGVEVAQYMGQGTCKVSEELHGIQRITGMYLQSIPEAIPVRKVYVGGRREMF
jgi:hypothetical protein